MSSTAVEDATPSGVVDAPIASRYVVGEKGRGKGTTLADDATVGANGD